MIDKKIVYADNAATTKLDGEAFNKMSNYFLEEYGNASQPYSFSRSSRKALKEAREMIATCINADSEEIYFTSCGTESDNWAIKGCKYGDKGTLITSEIEHHAVLNSANSIADNGVEVILIKPNKKGEIVEENLESLVSENTSLVSIMMANNEIGTLQPIKELAEIAHSVGALFHTDAVQAVGHIKIDVKDLNVDMLSASGHKFNGPKGVGFIYIKKGTDIKNFLDGGKQEKSMRAGTENIPAIIGMATALKINCDELENNQSKLKKIEEIFLSRLSEEGNIDFIKNGSDNTIPGNISVSFRDMNGESLLHLLDLNGICVSTGSACNSGTQNVSHVLKAIDVPEEYIHGTIRVSFGKYNTSEEAEKVADCIIRIIRKIHKKR